jgi:hypothetical protein
MTATSSGEDLADDGGRLEEVWCLMRRAIASALARRIRSGYPIPASRSLRSLVTSQGSDPAAIGSPDGLTTAGGRLAIGPSSRFPTALVPALAPKAKASYTSNSRSSRTVMEDALGCR